MKELKISTPSCVSEIYCGRDVFADRTQKLCGGKNFIVTDSNVFSIYGGLIKSAFGDSPVFVIPAGEASKNYKQLLKIIGGMLEKGVTRSSTVIALGGGVVGDIAGLAASLYMRGVRLVQIPTTLLSQVDSSVGGKTAVDFNGVKNVIGTFYQPHEVVADSMFFSTLPRREIRCGLGEIIKYGALDAQIYNKLIKNSSRLFSSEFLEDIVYDCIAHKARVVTEDEKDLTGVRKTLNLGHTTGHAFELYYKRKSHGEFVLIGMYYELFIAEKLGVCGREYAQSLRGLIYRVIGAVPAYEGVEQAALLAKFDKKNSNTATVSAVVPSEAGISREIQLPVGEYVELIRECRDGLKEGK